MMYMCVFLRIQLCTFPRVHLERWSAIVVPDFAAVVVPFLRLTSFDISVPVSASGTQFENSSEIGVFSKLTNAYCLTAIGGSENFYRFVSAAFCPVALTNKYMQ